MRAVTLLLALSLTACARPTPADPHPTRDAVREVLVEILGGAVEVACDPTVSAELRPGEDRPVARALFDAMQARLCKPGEVP